MHSHCFAQYTRYNYTCPVCSKTMGDMSMYFRMIDSLVARSDDLPAGYACRKQVRLLLPGSCMLSLTASFTLHFLACCSLADSHLLCHMNACQGLMPGKASATYAKPLPIRCRHASELLVGPVCFHLKTGSSQVFVHLLLQVVHFVSYYCVVGAGHPMQ